MWSLPPQLSRRLMDRYCRISSSFIASGRVGSTHSSADARLSAVPARDGTAAMQAAACHGNDGYQVADSEDGAQRNLAGRRAHAPPTCPRA